MKTIEKINGKIVHHLDETTSIHNENVRYFVIKVKGDNGVNYDISPSSDTNEYEAWKELMKDGVGKSFEGFQYGGQGKRGPYLNKHVLPRKSEVPQVKVNTLFDN